MRSGCVSVRGETLTTTGTPFPSVEGADGPHRHVERLRTACAARER